MSSTFGSVTAYALLGFGAVACSSQPEASALDDELDRISAGGDSASVTVAGVFGTKWKEGVIVCPGTSPREVADELGANERDVQSPAEGEALIGLADTDGWKQWLTVAEKDLVLCEAGARELVPVSSDQALRFELAHDNWTLVGPSNR